MRLNHTTPTLCACGCGQNTKPGRRFIWGHSLRTRHIPPLVERFWNKVNRAGPDACWLWKASLGTNGYGLIGVNGRTVTASRFAYELANGPIPPDRFVLHTCDNRACVNPAHLFLGDARTNSLDMVSKGRHGASTSPDQWARGERQGGAKLTSEQVLAIRSEYAAGKVSMSQLAKKYGVCTPHVWALIHHVNWQHLP